MVHHLDGVPKRRPRRARPSPHGTVPALAPSWHTHLTLDDIILHTSSQEEVCRLRACDDPRIGRRNAMGAGAGPSVSRMTVLGYIIGSAVCDSIDSRCPHGTASNPRHAEGSVRFAGDRGPVVGRGSCRCGTPHACAIKPTTRSTSDDVGRRRGADAASPGWRSGPVAPGIRPASPLPSRLPRRRPDGLDEPDQNSRHHPAPAGFRKPLRGRRLLLGGRLLDPGQVSGVRLLRCSARYLPDDVVPGQRRRHERHRRQGGDDATVRVRCTWRALRFCQRGEFPRPVRPCARRRGQRHRSGRGARSGSPA